MNLLGYTIFLRKRRKAAYRSGNGLLWDGCLPDTKQTLKLKKYLKLLFVKPTAPGGGGRGGGEGGTFSAFPKHTLPEEKKSKLYSAIW